MAFLLRGSLPDVTELPLNAKMGDAYLVSGVTYTYINGVWSELGNPVKNNLCYAGIAVTLFSENDLESLFVCPSDLSEDDLEFFKITYPEDYRTFEYLLQGGDKVA